MCRSCYIARLSYNAYEDVDFKTLSGRYTNNRMVPFFIHIDGDRANLFSINPRQKMTPL